MAVVFKYKLPISQTYAPGYSRPGASGPTGISGKSGNALYFIEYDLDNSYNIEQALQRIENNKVISVNSEEELQNRKYQVNDILLSNSGKSYRIIEASKDSLFSNYTYDIEYLGEMNKTNTSPVKFIVIYDFTNATFYKEGTSQYISTAGKTYAGDIIKQYKAEEKSCYVTNRTEKPYTSIFTTNNKDYSLIGSWIKIIGYSTVDTTPKYNNITGIEGAKHSFVIQLDNKKNISCNSNPVTYDKGDPIQTDETGGYSINFKKKLEYPNIKTFDNISLDSSVLINSLLSELIPDNNKKVEYDESTPYKISDYTKSFGGLLAKDYDRYNIAVPECTTAYLSDYSLDSLHPSGNNIRCTINNDRTMWYKSGVKASEIETNTNLPVSIKENDDFYKVFDTQDIANDKDEDIKVERKIKKDIYDSLTSYGAGMSFTPVQFSLKKKIIDKDGNVSYDKQSVGDSSTSTLMSPNIFPQYAIGLSLSDAKEDDLQKEINELYNIGYCFDGNDIDNDYYSFVKKFSGINTGKNQFNFRATGSNSNANASPLPINSYVVTVKDASTVNGYSRNGFVKFNYNTYGNSNRVSLAEINGNGYEQGINEKFPRIYFNDIDLLRTKNTTETAYASIAFGDIKGYNTQPNQILQLPKYPSYILNTPYCTNYKGGNSLYFSGIDSVEDTYNNIFNYLIDPMNVFSIVTTYEKTKEMVTSVVPVIVNTTFRDSSVYVSFAQGSGRSTIIKSLRINKMSNGKRYEVNYTYR